MWYFQQKIRKIFWRVGTAPSPDPSPSGKRIPLPTLHPSRHLDPSHSKILGTPLCLWSNEFLFVNCAWQNDIIEWSRDHRLHHKYSETDADPHNALRGFFFSHCGWLMVRKHPEVKEKGKQIDMTDLLSDPVCTVQRKWATLLVFRNCENYCFSYYRGQATYLFRQPLGLHWIWLFQIRPEPELAEYRNWNSSRSGFGENLFWDHRTICLMKLMAWTILSAAIKRQYSFFVTLLFASFD